MVSVYGNFKINATAILNKYNSFNIMNLYRCKKLINKGYFIIGNHIRILMVSIKLLICLIKLYFNYILFVSFV